MCLLVEKEANRSQQGGPGMTSIADGLVKIQTTPESNISTPSWFGEAHGLRNEVAPWRSSAPRPLSLTPRAKRWWIVAFRLHSGTRCWMHMTREGRPQLIFDLSLHFSKAAMRISFYRFWW